jgi:hypothetical protein
LPWWVLQFSRFWVTIKWETGLLPPISNRALSISPC